MKANGRPGAYAINRQFGVTRRSVELKGQHVLALWVSNISESVVFIDFDSLYGGDWQ
jgi:hypothetical protein